MGVFTGRDRVRRERIDERYSVTDDGLVWSGDLPLEAIGGVGVNLHGKRVKIAYLVARAFVPDGECRKWVRHKNGDVRDNRAENLEWSDEKEECRRGRKPMLRWIMAWHMDGEQAGIWSSVSDAAAEVGVKPSEIRECLAGKRKQAGGLLWRDA